MKLDEVTSRIFLAAYNEAKFRNHEYFTPEHVLYSSLFFEDSAALIKSVGGNISVIQQELDLFFEKHMTIVEDSDPVESLGITQLIQSTMIHAASSEKDLIKIGDIIAAMYEQNDSFASYILLQNGINKIDILNYISHGISIVPTPVYHTHNDEKNEFETDSNLEDMQSMPNKGFLSQFTIDLTEKARRGEIDPLIGRDDILNRTMQVLSRRYKNNPIHVGDPGVGKTAITEGLASLIVDGKVPRMLSEYRILYLDIGSILAGTKYRGDFEERLKKVMKEIEDLGKTIVYIDEIHTIIGAGAVSGNSLDASNILKPVLLTGKIRFIGCTTYEEYKKIFEKDRALSRRFQKIEIPEPSIEDTFLILKGLRDKYESYHNVIYSEEALHAAAELSAKYIIDRHLPDKAIDLIDESGAFARLNSLDEDTLKIDVKDIERVVSLIAKIPEQSISTDEIDKLKDLDTAIKKEIFGQEAAIETIVKAIKCSRAGFNESEKPVASLLFVGPTGVGKTEISKQLSNILGIPLIRFDMSEYQEKHTVARLIGAPPGYVGYEEGGLLTDAIRKTPYCVLLLDEIEKAHPDIFNILLQVMDYATLTDNNGKKADFRNVILIMTSNAGAREVGKTMIGFEKRIMDKGSIVKEVERIFSPEFRNRLDEVVIFNHINEEMAVLIAKKALHQFEEKLKAKNIKLKATKNCYNWLAQKGLSSVFGAREILRVVQDKIKTYFVDEVLFGSLSNGGTAVIDVINDEIVIKTI